MDRRAFLASGAALALTPGVSRSQKKIERLRLAVGRQSLVGAAYPATEVWAYNGMVPGPELRFKQGERLRVEVENALGVATTVHWHGIRLPNAMDGVPGVTQAPIAAKGGRFSYEFELPDAGTYWYHPHLGGPEQVSRGLYGALVVEEREPPEADRDVVWVLSDWELDREARLDEEFANPMAASHDGQNRQHRHAERPGAGQLRGAIGRAHSPAAHQCVLRADLRACVRRACAERDCVRRPAGRAASPRRA